MCFDFYGCVPIYYRNKCMFYLYIYIKREREKDKERENEEKGRKERDLTMWSSAGHP